MHIEVLTPRMARENVPHLIELLKDAVDSGASVGFLPPLSRDEANEYWQFALLEIEEGTRILIVAFDGDQVVGSAQLALALKPNALHRAEVQRVIVHRSHRRRGIGEQLMREIEDVARRERRTLLVLDTREGDPSELLYQKLGYTKGGVIPRYARSADGSLHATVLYYRDLEKHLYFGRTA
jgi:acetyltransferase